MDKETQFDNDWSSIRTHDPSDPHTINKTKYFYKGEACDRIMIKSPIAKKVAAYSLIAKDCRSIIGWLKKIEEIDPDLEQSKNFDVAKGSEELIKALWIASVTLYGKCFSQAKGRGLKLEKTFLDEEFHGLHDAIIHARNNHAAHSGDIAYEKAEIALVLFPKKYKAPSAHIFKELFHVSTMVAANPDHTFLDLVEHVKEKIRIKSIELEYKILEEEFHNKDESELRKKARRLGLKSSKS